jgi:hypothetical protein
VNRYAKLLLGILSLSPILFFCVFFLWLLPSFFRTAPGAPSFRDRFELIVPFAIATAASVVLQTILYGVVLARRTNLAVIEKVGIPAVILVTNGIVLPFVWWLYIWKGRPASPRLPERTSGSARN